VGFANDTHRADILAPPKDLRYHASEKDATDCEEGRERKIGHKPDKLTKTTDELRQANVREMRTLGQSLHGLRASGDR